MLRRMTSPPMVFTQASQVEVLLAGLQSLGTGRRQLSCRMTYNSRSCQQANIHRKPLSRIIQIRVGEHHFNVYLDFLQWWAPRLADECVSFANTTRPVMLWQVRDVDPDVFGLFVQWIYTQSLLNKHRQPAYQHRCMGLWVLAKRLDMKRLQNEALNTLHTRMRMEGLLQVKALGYVYQNTTEGDALRRYVFDVCRKQMNLFPQQVIDEMIPKAMMDQMIVAGFLKLEDLSAGILETDIDIRKYHIPGVDGLCG